MMSDSNGIPNNNGKIQDNNEKIPWGRGWVKHSADQKYANNEFLRSRQFHQMKIYRRHQTEYRYSQIDCL